MNEFRTRLGEDGRVVIPAPCRKLLQLEAGEELIIRVENNELHLHSLSHSLKKAQNLVQRYAKKQSLVQKLKSLRQEDSRNE